jgi:hypothetical protein
MDYHTPAQCLASLQKLPADPGMRHAILSAIIAGLLEAKPAPNQHFEVMEAARQPIDTAQAELIASYAGQPLPPGSQHDKTLLKIIDLWWNMARSYAQITQRSTQLGTLRDQHPLLAQRRMYYVGKIVAEYYHAHRTLPGGLWKEVHEAFLAAEAANLTRIRVPDPLNQVWKAQSALEAYITILLIDLANPFGRTGHEWTWICRWAQRFAPYCTLDTDITGRKPTTYALDPTADFGLRPLGLFSKSIQARYFDCTKLAAQIQSVFAQFKQGVSPLSLGLGDDCSIESCAHLLLSLYRPWGLASAGRRFPRRGSQGRQVDLTTDWFAIGFHIQGMLFEQPRRSNTHPAAGLDYLGTQNDTSLLIFGEHAAGVETDSSNAKRDFARLNMEAERLGLVCERWELLDQSVGGFRLQRQLRTDERIEHHQLVGIRPQDGEYFLLGQISWLMFHETDMLKIGIHVLPGLPQVVAARLQAVSPDSPREPYLQAFMIGANEVLRVSASLILPTGWFRPQGIVELSIDGHDHEVRMTQLLNRGPNFEQVVFNSVSA